MDRSAARCRRASNPQSTDGCTNARRPFDTTSLHVAQNARGIRLGLTDFSAALSAEEAAVFFGLALQTVRNMTARCQLPCIKTDKRVMGYRPIDLNRVVGTTT